MEFSSEQKGHPATVKKASLVRVGKPAGGFEIIHIFIGLGITW